MIHWAVRHRPVASPRSSNRTLRISRIRLCASEGEKHSPSITATSASGYKQTSSRPKWMSALPPTTDIPRPTLDFRC